MLLNKNRASYQFIYGEPRKSCKTKFWNSGKYKWSWYLNKIATLNLDQDISMSEIKRIYRIIRILIFIWCQYDIEHWYH